jgi:hypothetical protein
MTDATRDPTLSARFRPDEIADRARSALAEGRTISHERMTEWFCALERDDGNDPDPPETIVSHRVV